MRHYASMSLSGLFTLLQSVVFLFRPLVIWHTFLKLLYRLPISKTSPVQYPPTAEQLDHEKNTFIDSIDQDAVCALASQNYNGNPCEIFGTANGSYNACFFVRFPVDNTRWTVRVPIEPAIHKVWDKVQSEVTTMKYDLSPPKISISPPLTEADDI
jgi:hypothetical protein